jgi:hypothetical protein
MEEVTPVYLVYTTYQEANDRSDLEGQRMNYSYWSNTGSTRQHTSPFETSNGKWALNVAEYQLSITENLAKKSSV